MSSEEATKRSKRRKPQKSSRQRRQSNRRDIIPAFAQTSQVVQYGNPALTMSNTVGYCCFYIASSQMSGVGPIMLPNTRATLL